MKKELLYALAIDIGGTKMASAVIAPDGRLQSPIDSAPVPFSDDGKADAQKIIQWISLKKDEFKGKLEGIGLSICGNVEEDTGFVPLSPNLHWQGEPFGQLVLEAFGLPVMAATDVRMAALAEAVWGAAKGKKYFAWVTIGTGYGGYLFLNGLPYRGLHGYAGNFGHNTWDEFNGDYCGCGNKGCVETFVSGPSIAKSGQALYDAGQMPIFDEMPHEEPISTRDVFSAAGKGDPGAIGILEEAQRITAISLAGLVNTLDLELLVIGGGVANGSPEYVASIDRKIRTYLMMDEAKRDLRVVKESLPNLAPPLMCLSEVVELGLSSLGVDG